MKYSVLPILLLLTACGTKFINSDEYEKPSDPAKLEQIEKDWAGCQVTSHDQVKNEDGHWTNIEVKKYNTVFDACMRSKGHSRTK